MVPARRSSAHLPALAWRLPGYGRDEDLSRSKEAGFEHHLVKPIRVATLQAALASLASAAAVLAGDAQV
jgi:CheY-like chemotaxis protein